MLAISDATEELVKDALAKGRFKTADEAIQTAFAFMDERERQDEEARTAIAEGTAQIERGEWIPWSEFSGEIREMEARLREAAK